MTNDFDKEIDSLLRQTARDNETAFAALVNPKSKIQNPKSLHVDADEISLFAENVLPVETKMRVTEHLADCERCRKILSNVISLNSETGSENVHAKEIAGIPASIPWYKKLFAFPQIAYTMGALVIIFSGIIGFLILKNVVSTQNSSVAQIEKMPESQAGVQNNESESATDSADESYAMSNNSSAASSNASMAANNSVAMANTANSAANKQSLTLAKPSGNQAVREDRSAEAERNVTTDSLTAVAPQNRPDDNAAKDSVAARSAPAAKSKPESRMVANETVTVTKNEAEASKEQVPQPPPAAAATTLNSRSISELPLNGRSMSELSMKGADKKENKEDKKARKTSAEPTRTVSGKTFKRADGVWYDSAYNQQKTTNIRRNTDEYKKLDSGLRSIAENLSGTVVVVWKDKAYRIQ